MDKYYLTEKIFIKDNIFFYEYKDSINPIEPRNWHVILKEYGWEKLNKKWIVKLNKLTDHKSKNSLFGCLDCGEDGDCLFNCISYAIYPQLEVHNIQKNSKELRYLLSESIDDELYNDIIDIYKISKNSNEFEEDWDPFTITKQDFKRKVREGGDEFWGDFILLSILKKLLSINLIILYTNIDTGNYYYYPLLQEYNRNLKTIILSYENDDHFKLIGYYKDQKMNVLFKHDMLPIEILRLINI